jgi:hypothetical protein
MRIRSEGNLNTEFYQSSNYLLHLRHKYLPQNPVYEHPQPMFVPKHGRSIQSVIYQLVGHKRR